MEGFLLDVQPAFSRDAMEVWIVQEDGERILHREPYAPSFFVRSRGRSLEALETALRAVVGSRVVALRRVRRVCGLEESPSFLLEVTVRTFDDLPRVAEWVDRLGDYGSYELFNVDVRLTQRYLLEKGCFPLSRVVFEGGSLKKGEDDRESLNYTIPPLHGVLLEGAPLPSAGRPPTFDDPLGWVRLDKEERRGEESSLLEWITERLRTIDPDILWTRGGDTFLLPYLYHRACVRGVPLQLGRKPDPEFPRRRGRSFFSYGRIRYSPPSYVLRGRIHIDTDSSFFYREGGWEALVDLSRVSGVPLQELARIGAGTVVTALQIDRAYREGRLIPWKKNSPESFKTARDLWGADRGAFTWEPLVGPHEDVVELDFASLFPHIMVRKNLSPETILCSCCGGTPSPLEVPQIGYHVCTRREGFIPRTVRPLLERREHFKRMRREDPENRDRYQSLSDAYKWCLVTTFGYQGYRNARFGRIECHEAINAWGREILLSASEVAREKGFEVLHGVVDSLWVERLRPWADEEELAEAVSREIGIPFEIEGRYLWIVFLPNRTGWGGVAPPVGAPTRYYGLFEKPPSKPLRSQAGQPLDYLCGGALKVRGVEMRQHSTPPFVRRVQEVVLTTLAEARHREELLRTVPKAVECVEPLLLALRRGEVPPEDLLVTVVASRQIEEYRSRTLAWSALALLRRAGVRVPPGDTVRYLVLDSTSSDPFRRVVEARLLTGREGYDVGFYLRSAAHAVESLLLPFGWTAPRLLERWSGIVPSTLDTYLKL